MFDKILNILKYDYNNSIDKIQKEKRNYMKHAIKNIKKEIPVLKDQIVFPEFEKIKIDININTGYFIIEITGINKMDKIIEENDSKHCAWGDSKVERKRLVRIFEDGIVKIIESEFNKETLNTINELSNLVADQFQARNILRSMLYE